MLTSAPRLSRITHLDVSHVVAPADNDWAALLIGCGPGLRVLCAAGANLGGLSLMMLSGIQVCVCGEAARQHVWCVCACVCVCVGGGGGRGGMSVGSCFVFLVGV